MPQPAAHGGGRFRFEQIQAGVVVFETSQRLNVHANGSFKLKYKSCQPRSLTSTETTMGLTLAVGSVIGKSCSAPDDERTTKVNEPSPSCTCANNRQR